MTPLDLDSGDTAWILTSAALVMLMTPGLAFFYGGMVRGKSVLNMMMMSFAALGIVPILWVLFGYGLAFGNDVGGLVGDPRGLFGLGRLLDEGVDVPPGATYPTLAFVGFQMVFAIITLALISGAIADRARFSTWLIFAVVWISIVYFPVAHWVWGGGWIGAGLGVIDFAGGTAVHINAGAAGLALALVLGRRIGWRRDPMRPHNVPFVMLGAALLWFGWFGFNAGSAVAADHSASLVWVNTMVATAAAMMAWLITERIRDQRFTSLGAASGAVAGLVAITPACASLSPVGSLLLGLVVGAVCCLAVGVKFRLGFDDSLDVVAVHLVGGLIGTVAVGLLGTDVGLFYGHGLDQLWRQVVGAVVVLVVSFGVTYLIGFVLNRTIGFRAAAEHEQQGVDEVMHGETAYDSGPLGRATRPASPHPTPVVARDDAQHEEVLA